MIGLAADENLDNDIVRALRRRMPDVDIIRAQDAGPQWARRPDDPRVGGEQRTCAVDARRLDDDTLAGQILYLLLR